MVKRGGEDGGRGHEEERRDQRERKRWEEEMRKNGYGGSSKQCVCAQGFIGILFSRSIFSAMPSLIR